LLLHDIVLGILTMGYLFSFQLCIAPVSVEPGLGFLGGGFLPRDFLAAFFALFLAAVLFEDLAMI